jgi:hypothetical protein
MKATLLNGAVALFATAAFAAEQPPAAPPAAPSTVVQTTLSVAPAVTQQDSPLVAAAKRSGRLGKKPTSVITNDTLLKSGGHFTTTASQEALPAAKGAPGPSASNAPVTTNNTPAPGTPKKDDKAEKAAASAAAAQAKKANSRAVADYAGDSVENVSEDPSQQEGIIRATATPAAATPPKPLQNPAPPKPPTR